MTIDYFINFLVISFYNIFFSTDENKTWKISIFEKTEKGYI